MRILSAVVFMVNEVRLCLRVLMLTADDDILVVVVAAAAWHTMLAGNS